jgi:hypothetical protein
MEWLFEVNFREIPHGKPACWRTLLLEDGGEKVNVTETGISSDEP